MFISKDSNDFRLSINLPGDHYIIQKLIEWKQRTESRRCANIDEQLVKEVLGIEFR